jgi:hypothetical protein
MACCTHKLHDAEYLKATILSFEDEFKIPLRSADIVIEPCFSCGSSDSFYYEKKKSDYVFMCWKCIIQSMFRSCDLPLQLYNKKKCGLQKCENMSYFKFHSRDVEENACSDEFVTCKKHAYFLHIVRIKVLLYRLTRSQYLNLRDSMHRVRFDVLLFVWKILRFFVRHELGLRDHEQKRNSFIQRGIYIMKHSPHHAQFLTDNFLHYKSPIGLILISHLLGKMSTHRLDNILDQLAPESLCCNQDESTGTVCKSYLWSREFVENWLQNYYSFFPQLP